MKIRVKYRKLGKEQAHGIAYPDRNLIEIDERLKGKKFVDTLIHEGLHLLNPEFSETKIIEQSKVLTDLLWKENLRRVEK